MVDTHANSPAGFNSTRSAAPRRRTGWRHQTGRLSLWLSLVIALSGFPPSNAAVSSAQTDARHVVYIPWVANDETIGGQGPWHGVVSFQNLGDDFCALEAFTVQDGAWVRTTQLSLTAGQSRSIPGESLRVPSPGAPVRFDARCEIAVSLKQYSPNTRQAPWSDGAQVVTGYTALSEPDLAAARASGTSTWFLPIVQTNSDWNTFLRVSNFAGTAANVTVEIYPAGNIDGVDGAARTLEQTIDVTGTWTIDALAVLGSSGFVGFARITADADVGVIAQRVKPGAMLAITNVAVAAGGSAAGEYRTAAPLLFNAYNGWNTGVTMANVSDQPAIVRIQYFPSDGEMLREESLVIAARSMQYIYTPGTVDQAGFVGSATILSDQPIVAAIDEVKYETSEALSYMASAVPQQLAGIPVVFREDPSNGLNDNSGVSIVNLDPNNARNVLLRLRDRAGNELLDLPIAVRVPAGGSSFIYLPFIDEIPAGTNGSVILESASEAGFVAISNDINYASGGDGSVVFSAAGDSGVFHIPVPEP